MIQKLYEVCDVDHCDASSDWRSCEGESDCCSTTSGFESASGDWPDSDHWDAESDLDAPFALPAVHVEQPAWRGTRQHLSCRRVQFNGNSESVCDASDYVDYGLIDGSWERGERLAGRVEDALRAIARARQQRCDVVAEMPVSDRAPLREEHPCVLVRLGEDVLKLDPRCSWSTPGYEPRYVGDPADNVSVPILKGELSAKAS